MQVSNLPPASMPQSNCVQLQCHPQTVCTVISQIWVKIQRSGNMALQYAITGDISAIRIAEPGRSVRKDELWRHTCAELFVGAIDSAEYFEFNFAPSSEWAAYSFTDHRQGMRPLACDPPAIVTKCEDDRLLIETQLELPPSLRMKALQLGLTMVIEDRNGNFSYWALRHTETPDFHQRSHWLSLA